MTPAYVTESDCGKRVATVKVRWGVLFAVVGLVCTGSVYLVIVAESARAAATAVDLKVEVQKATITEFRDSLRDKFGGLDSRLGGIENDIKAMRKEQADFFRGRPQVPK